MNPAAFSADLPLQIERGGTGEGRSGDIAMDGEEIREESGRRPRVRRWQQATGEGGIAMEGEEIRKESGRRPARPRVGRRQQVRGEGGWEQAAASAAGKGRRRPAAVEALE